MALGEGTGSRLGDGEVWVWEPGSGGLELLWLAQSRGVYWRSADTVLGQGA